MDVRRLQNNSMFQVIVIDLTLALSIRDGLLRSMWYLMFDSHDRQLYYCETVNLCRHGNPCCPYRARFLYSSIKNKITNNFQLMKV